MLQWLFFYLSFFKTQINGLSSVCQPNVGMLDRSAAGGSAGGMLDRSRMALCAFTFLFLSLNPLAALLCSSGSSSSANAATATHPAGRSVLGVDIAGTRGLNAAGKGDRMMPLSHKIVPVELWGMISWDL